MADVYSSVAKVRLVLDEIGSSPADANISQYIEWSQGFVNALLKEDFTKKFDTTKFPQHFLIEGLTTHLAAFMTIIYNPGNFASVSESALLTDLLWGLITLERENLTDPRVLKFLGAKE